MTKPRIGISIRDAVLIALEGLPGAPAEWVALPKQRDAMRHHVLAFVHEFAHKRGVILEDVDVLGELDAVVAELTKRRVR